MQITLTVNGISWSGDIQPRKLLADFLRTDLRLTGTHLACEHGICGACTVLINDQPARSCLVFAVQADGCAVTTVEALSADGLSELQKAFVERRALQCGFCTPGFLMTGEALIRSGQEITEDVLREHLSGHICRCTGYAPIVAAFRDALNVSQSER